MNGKGQDATAGDNFWAGPHRAVVTRVSRNPDKPWVDIEVYPNDQIEGMWTKRMPIGIPANWTRVETGRIR